MSTLRLRLQNNQTAHGRCNGIDFDLTNLRGTLRLAFSNSAQLHFVPKDGTVLEFDDLEVRIIGCPDGEIVRFATTGAPILHEENYLCPDDAQTDEDNLYVAIQEYWLNGDYSDEAKSRFMGDIKSRLREIGQKHPEKSDALNEVWSYLLKNRGIAALIEVEHLIQSLEDSSSSTAPDCQP